jgi:hypothetical protein
VTSQRTLANLAERLTKLSQRPEHVGTTWTWDKIAALLDCPVGQAHQVIYYLRKNDTERWWTVGTAASGFTMVPTTSFHEALDAVINQYRHLRTRVQSAWRVSATLANVDPDPQYSQLARREARLHRRYLEDLDEHLETLIDLRDNGGAAAAPVTV